MPKTRRDWRTSAAGRALFFAIVLFVWLPKPGGLDGPINYIVDAICIPFGLWLAWPEVRKLKPARHDSFRPLG